MRGLIKTFGSAFVVVAGFFAVLFGVSRVSTPGSDGITVDPSADFGIAYADAPYAQADYGDCGGDSSSCGGGDSGCDGGK